MGKSDTTQEREQARTGTSLELWEAIEEDIVRKVRDSDEIDEWLKKELLAPPDIALDDEEFEEIENKIRESSAGYTKEQKMLAVWLYMMLGKTATVAKHLNIRPATIRYWKYECEWWPRLTRVIRKARGEELDNKLSKIIDAATDQLYDRIQEGDFKLQKDGSMKRVPLPAKELAIHGLTIPFEKRALLRGDPTSRVQKTDVHVQLDNMADKFVELADRVVKMGGMPKQRTIDTEGNIITGEFENAETQGIEGETGDEKEQERTNEEEST